MAQGQQRGLDSSGKVLALKQPSPDLLVRSLCCLAVLHTLQMYIGHQRVVSCFKAKMQMMVLRDAACYYHRCYPLPPNPLQKSALHMNSAYLSCVTYRMRSPIYHWKASGNYN